MPELLENLSLKGGRNYAPLQPLIALRDRVRPAKTDYLTDALRERYKHYMTLDKDTWHDLITVGHLTSLFIQGKQNLKWNNYTKNFYTVPFNKQGSEKLRVTPIMRFYEENCESRYMSSNPRITVTAAREDDRCQQAAKGAKIVSDHYAQKLYTNRFNRAEALHMMSFGTQINQGRWNGSLSGWKAVRRIFEEKEIPISNGVGQCFDCGRVGTGSEFLQKSQTFASCPDEKCGSFNAYAEPPVTQIFPVETKKEQVNLGDYELRQLEFPAVRFDLRVEAENSSWFIYEQWTSLGAVRRMLGDVELPEDKLGENDFGLKVVESLARAGLAINGKTTITDEQVKSSLYRERVKLTEFYLSAEDLAGMRTGPLGEETVCGERLPGNTDYSAIYPEGANCVGLSGLNLILGVYPKAVHRDELTTGIWHMRQFSGAGQGVSDSVEINKRLNETDSQGYLGLKHSATPATMYAAGAIEKEYRQYLGNPDVAIPINTDAFENARSLQDIVTSPRIGNIDAGLMQYYILNLQNMMQLTMQVTSFSGGLPGVNNKTATGAQISNSNADALFTPLLGIKVDVYVRRAEMFVSAYRENVPVKQFFPLGGKFGAQQGVYLSGADLDKDLVFAADKNSELPKTLFTVRDDIDRFLFAAGGLAGAAQAQAQYPKFFNEISRKYDLEFEIDNFDEAEQVSRQRYEEAKALLGQFVRIEQATAGIAALLSPPDEPGELGPDDEQLELAQAAPAAPAAIPSKRPEAGPAGPDQPPVQNTEQPAAPAAPPTPAITPEQARAREVVASIRNPITPYEENHGEKAAWFSGFLDTDEGRNLGADLRAVVYEFVDAHFLAGAQREAQIQQMAGRVAVAGAMPGQAADVQKQQILEASKPAPNPR